MSPRLWTAEELEKLPRAQQQAIFDESIVSDVAEVRPDFLERVRADAKRLIESREVQRDE